MSKTIKRDAIRAALVKKTALETGVSQRTVQYVIKGDRINPKVLEFYMTLQEEENKLLKAVKELVKF